MSESKTNSGRKPSSPDGSPATDQTGDTPFTVDPVFDGLLQKIAAAPVGSDDPSEARPLPMNVGSTIGAFELLEVIGRGGSGVVYRARDARLGREVAIKLLWQDTANPEALLLEARKTASISDPRVASIYEVGQAQSRRFIAMELVRGASLRVCLQTQSPSETQRLRWALQIAQALQSIHAQGWIHQDVKAENIAVSEDGQIKLLDFGIARPVHQQSDQDIERAGAGTPAYMAPEQRRPGKVDARVDVFAFGVLLQELLIGRISKTPQTNQLKGRPGGRQLARLIAECLAPEPGLRPSSGAQLVARLTSIQRTPGRQKRVLIAAAAGLLFIAALAYQSRDTPSAKPGPRYAGRSKRLTGFELSRPLSAAALSFDGERFAYVDDDGLWLAPTKTPEKVAKIAFAPQAVFVSAIAHSPDWLVVSSTVPGERQAWRLSGDGKTRHKVWQGTFNIASVSPRAPRMALVKRTALGMLDLKGDEVWTTQAAKNQVFTNATWSPDGTRLAVSFVMLRNAGVHPCLEVWRVEDREVLFRHCSRRLIQAYTPVVHSWSPEGQLLYGYSDVPGQGRGAAVLAQTIPNTPTLPPAPTRLVYFERQSLSSISMAKDHRLLTLRQDIRLRPALAQLTEDGSFSSVRQLDKSEFDSRLSAWTSNQILWRMRYREWVPKAGRFDLKEGPLAQPELPGWAQTWVTPSGEGALFWYAEAPQRQEAPVWKLAMWSRGEIQKIDIPVQPKAHLGASGTPPYTAQVRCAARTQLCLLGAQQSDGYRFYRLSLSASPAQPLFLLEDFRPILGAWQLLEDGSGIVVGLEGQLSRYDLQGKLVHRQPLHEIDRVRSLGISLSDGAIYASGMGALPDNFRIVRVHKGQVRSVAKHPAIAYLDVLPSLDGRRLAFVQKLIDTDLWLNFPE